ncbi:MAG: outer membrane lipoprotein carrier protein LolA [Bacillota bacterium]
MKILAAWLMLLAAAVQADAPPKPYAASFVQTRTLPGFDAPIVSRGNLRYDKTHGFHWEISSPYHYVFEMNGAKAREELPDGTARDLDPEQNPWLVAVERIFVGALSGDRFELTAYFDVKTEPAPGGQSVTLTPKPGPMAEAIVSIHVIESEPGRPERMEISETSGGHMDIRFSPVVAP